MEPPPVAQAQYISQNSRKRVLSGTSSSFMDPEVTEIPPPVFQTLRRRKPKNKQKQVIPHEVIDLDKDEDSADVIIVDEIVKMGNKGKAIKNISDGSDSYQPKESSKSSASGLHNLPNLNSYHDQHANFHDDFMDVEDYSLLQAYFESADIPAGVEAPVPWLADPSLRKEKMVNGSNSVYIELASVSSSSVQKAVDVVDHPPEMDLSSFELNAQSAPSKNSAALQGGGSSAQNVSLDVKSSTQPWIWGKSKSNSKPAASGILTNYNYVDEFDPMTYPHGVETASWTYDTFSPVQNQVGTSNSFYSGMPSLADTVNIPPVVGPFVPWWQNSVANYPTPNFYDQLDAATIPPEEWADTPSAPDGCRNMGSVDEDDILRKFKLFKQFDVVEDHSDHHHASKHSSAKQPTNKWVKRIQDEWKILENDLPDTIFVRVYESRIDILRAVIVGAEGTPYHDGLFFFDVFFPSGYPSVPPHVYYHSRGLRLNPNLYNCGKVCLSLLNTWNGQKNEKWIPSVSTMLQVLVSIQALILNEKPYFNEPGYASTNGTPHGETQSQMYNESAFLLSLKTMLYTLRRPPKHFKDFVMGHFYKRAHDILSACKAYMDGAQVGCAVKSGVQNVALQGNKNRSQQFKNSLAGYIDLLVKEFAKIGAKDTEKFLTQAKGGVPGVGNKH